MMSGRFRWTRTPNYADRYRHGASMSMAFAEADHHQAVSKHMVKKPQLRWNEAGTHHLPQAGADECGAERRVVGASARWYPGMQLITKESLR